MNSQGKSSKCSVLRSAYLLSFPIPGRFRNLLKRMVRTAAVQATKTRTKRTSELLRSVDRLGLAGNKQIQDDPCYGQQALDKIVNWRGPTAAGDSEEPTVFYTYRIENLADWAKNPDIQKVFPRNCFNH